MTLTRGKFEEASELAAAVMADVPKRAQTQASLDAQLRTLHLLAVRAGLYDAADWLQGRYRF